MSGKSNLHDCQSEMFDLLMFVDKICSNNNLSYWIDGGTLLGAVRHNGFIPWDDDVDICLLYPDYLKLLDLLEEACLKHKYFDTFYRKNGLDYWCEYLGSSKLLAHGMLPTRIDLIPIKAIPNTEKAIKIDRSLNNIANFFIKGKFKNESCIIDEHKEKYLNDFKNIDRIKRIFFEDYRSYMNSNSCLGCDLLFTYSFHDMLVKSSRRYFIFDELFPTSLVDFKGRMLPAPNNIDSYLKTLYGDNYMTPPPKNMQKPYANIYFINDVSKEITFLNSKIFLEREVEHYKARAQKNKIKRYKYKLISFLAFTKSCIKNKVFIFWIKHLVYLFRMTIFKTRF